VDPADGHHADGHHCQNRLADYYFAMLEDRDYMRQPEYGEPRWMPRFQPRWSWTVALLAAYAVVFVAELVMARFVPENHFLVIWR